MNSVEKLRGRCALVVGDAMIDRYVRGPVSRVSPEAPVPVLEFSGQEDRLGGAANVALNVQSLGSRAIVCSIVGHDFMDSWNRLFIENNLTIDGLIFSEKRISTIKTRFIGNGQQLMRLDTEDTTDVSIEESTFLLKKIEETIERDKVDVVVLQDYNKGVLTGFLIEKIIAFSVKKNIPVAVDPKRNNFFSYKGATLFKPNLKEIREAMGQPIEPTVENLNAAAKVLRERLDHGTTMVTLSEHGIYTEKAGIGTICPTRRRAVADVSGAGDTVIAVAALGLAAGLPMGELARLCNIAGGQVCEVAGVAAVEFERLAGEAATGG